MRAPRCWILAAAVSCSHDGPFAFPPDAAQPKSTDAAVCPSVEDIVHGVVGVPEWSEGIIPTEAQLACNAAKYPRLTVQPTAVGVVPDGSWEERPDSAGKLGVALETRYILDTYDGLVTAGFPHQMSGMAYQYMPPHLGFHSSTNGLQFPEDRPQFELSSRAYGAVLLRERAAGRPVVYHLDYGPHEFAPPKTLSEMTALIQTVVIPRTTIVAQAAEAIGAEYLNPFAGEADVGVNLLPNMTTDDRVAFVQQYVDAVSTTARQHFHGKLLGSTVWQYYPPNDGFWSLVPMERVRWTGYDVLRITSLPVMNGYCTAARAGAQMAAQIAKIIEITQRDHIGWAIDELYVFTFPKLSDYTTCGADPYTEFFPAWDAVLNAIATASVKPEYVMLTNGPAAWTGDQSIQSGLVTRFNAFVDRVHP